LPRIESQIRSCYRFSPARERLPGPATQDLAEMCKSLHYSAFRPSVFTCVSTYLSLFFLGSSIAIHGYLYYSRLIPEFRELSPWGLQITRHHVVSVNS